MTKGAAILEQIIFAGENDNPHFTITEYNSLVGGRSWDPTEAHVYQLISTDGVIKNLRVKLAIAPGVGKHWDFTLILNGNPTALTLEIADAATSGSNMVNEVTVTGGDTVSLQCDPDNTPTAGKVYWTCVFEGDTAKESLIMGGSEYFLNNAVTEYFQVMCSGSVSSATENDFRQVVPTSGTIKDFYVKLSEDPGTAPDAYRFTLRKGGVSQTLTVTITADDTTGNDLVNSFAVVAGDILTLMIEPLNTPSATPFAVWGMTFVADIDGESIVLGGSTSDLNVGATEYNSFTGYEFTSWSATESNRYHLGQVCTLKKLHVLLSAAPSAGDSYEFRVRVNGADTDLGVLISNLETTGASSVSAKADIANDDYVNLQVVPINVPDVVDAYWGLVCDTKYVKPKYTPKIANFSIGADGAWTDYDLFTNLGVPKGRVAGIVCCNKNIDFARVAGVRTDGSALNRYIDLHEAEGGGFTTATMFVKCHETTGLIECYSEIQGDVEFKLLGYFNLHVDFTEAFTSLGQPGLVWADKDLTASGVPDDAVVQILMGNEADAANYFAGVRENGSALERGYVLDEAEADGWSALSMVAQSDAGAVIEWKGGSATDVTMWLLGWFSSNVSFIEGFTDYSPVADLVWESKTIAESAVSSIVDFALVHQDTGAMTFCGLREEGSVLPRMIEEHEAEGGASTGFEGCIFLDSVKKCEVYCQDASEAQFSYTGYFIVYTWEGKISGVTNPAKIMGVAVANIASVKGVA